MSARVARVTGRLVVIDTAEGGFFDFERAIDRLVYQGIVHRAIRRQPFILNRRSTALIEDDGRVFTLLAWALEGADPTLPPAPMTQGVLGGPAIARMPRSRAALLAVLDERQVWMTARQIEAGMLYGPMPALRSAMRAGLVIGDPDDGYAITPSGHAALARERRLALAAP